MTAEIAIINRQGIALAADSAVTIGKNRVWKTANKLFSLGPVNDIAVMIYNSGDFVGVSWEIIIKEFREGIGNKRFLSVKECEIRFFQYLDSSILSPSLVSDFSMIAVFISFIDLLPPLLGRKSLKDIQENLENAIESALADLRVVEELSEFISYEVFKKTFSSDISVICKEALGFRLTKPYLEKVIKMLYEILSRKNQSNVMSGVVFAGYGKDQLMPYMAHYCIDGKFEYLKGKVMIGQTRFWLEHRCDLNDKNMPSAYVYPFAQFDMFYLFMEGIIPRHLSYINNVLSKVLKEKSDSLIDLFVPPENQTVEKHLQEAENEEIVSSFNDEFGRFRSTSLVSPVLDIITALPKEEMASMAEALVELTALRRKVGSHLESVGGPTDVAVISKTEGLIWLKRKHYFKAELNGDYAVRRKLRREGE